MGYFASEEYISVHYRLAAVKSGCERWLRNKMILSPNSFSKLGSVSGCDEIILFILGGYLDPSILWAGLKPLGNSEYLWVPDVSSDFW